MGSCVGTCLAGWLKTEREREFVACVGKVASCKVFMGSYKGILCVCVCICVNSGFSPYKPLSESQSLDVTLALVKMWLLEERKKVVG